MVYHLWLSCIWVYIRGYVCVHICASLYVYGEKFCHVWCQSVLLVLFDQEGISGTAYFSGGVSNSSSLPGGERWSSDGFPFGRKPASFCSGFLPTFRSFFIFLLTPHPRNHYNCPLECQLIFAASCLFAQGKNADFLFAIWQMSKEKDWLHYVFLSAAWMNILYFSPNHEKI